MIRKVFNKLFPCKWGRCKDKLLGCNCGTFIGLSAGVIGTTALLGGGAALLFGGKKNKSPDLSELRAAPKPPQLTDFPIGRDTNEAIRRAISSGFGDQFVSQTTSPLTAELRAGFQERTLPGIESALSARGLGRSTIAARDIGRATQQNVRDINSVVAQAILQNEQAKERATGQGFQFAAAEAGQGTLAAQEEVRRIGVGLGFEQARGAQGSQDINQLIAAATQLGSAALTPPTTFNLGSIDARQQGELLDFLKRGKPRPFTVQT